MPPLQAKRPSKQAALAATARFFPPKRRHHKTNHRMKKRHRTYSVDAQAQKAFITVLNTSLEQGDNRPKRAAVRTLEEFLNSIRNNRHARRSTASLIINHIEHHPDDSPFIARIKTNLTSMEQAKIDKTLNPIIALLCRSQGATYDRRELSEDAQSISEAIHQTTFRLADFNI